MNITGNSTPIKASDRTVFEFITNFSHFKNYLPPEIKDFEATADYCKFNIQGVATLKLSIIEKVEYSLVVYNAENDKNIPLKISIFIKGNESFTSTVRAEMDADLPVFVVPMVKKPLEKFVAVLVEKLKEEIEKRNYES